MELKYQDTMVSNLDACIYFSPECKEYMDKMKVIVVEDDDVNAYTTMGNAFVKLSR